MKGKKLGKQLHPFEIKTGVTATADEDIFLMPRLHLDDVVRGDQINTLKAGDSFTVVSTAVKELIPDPVDPEAIPTARKLTVWYEVKTSPATIAKASIWNCWRPKELTVWMNSTNLLGKIIRKK